VGLFDFLKVYDSQFNLLLEKQINLVQGTGQPYAVLNLRSQTGQPIVAGDYLIYEPEFFSPVAEQFVIVPVLSSCPIDDFPIGSMSRPGVTYVKYWFNLHVLPMVKPAGVTGPYVVECSLTANFYFRSNPEVGYFGSLVFPVIVP
jgi:hypothetical protein